MWRIVAIEPDPRRVVDGYLDAMDRAADTHGRIIVGGVSIGAAVALQWAADNPDRTVSVLAALPAWTGLGRRRPRSSERAVHRRATALRRLGVGDRCDARVESGVARSRTRALLALSVARSPGWARRGGVVPLTRRERATGGRRSGRHCVGGGRSGSSRVSGAGLGGFTPPRRSRHDDARHDRARPRGSRVHLHQSARGDRIRYHRERLKKILLLTQLLHGRTGFAATRRRGRPCWRCRRSGRC